jgi:hypothetical protein
MRFIRCSTIGMLAFAMGGCGHGGASDGAAAAPPTATPAATPAAPDRLAGAAPALQPDDLDAYAKGMRKEIELRQAARDKAAKAKADNDQTAEISALAELTSVDITKAGAGAAGVDRVRYEAIKNAVDHVLGVLDMNAAMAGMGDAAQTAKLRSDPWQGLDPAFAAALKARRDELAELRSQNMAILMDAQKL